MHFKKINIHLMPFLTVNSSRVVRIEFLTLVIITVNYNDKSAVNMMSAFSVSCATKNIENTLEPYEEHRRILF